MKKRNLVEGLFVLSAASSLVLGGCMGQSSVEGQLVDENADAEGNANESEGDSDMMQKIMENIAEESADGAESSDVEESSEVENNSADDTTETEENLTDSGSDTVQKLVNFYADHYNGAGSYPVVADFTQSGEPEIFVVHDSGEGLYAALIGMKDNEADLVFDLRIDDEGIIDGDSEFVEESDLKYNVFYGSKDNKPAVAIEITKTLSVAFEPGEPENYIMWFFCDGQGGMTSQRVEGELDVNDIEKMADVCSVYSADGSSEFSTQTRINKGLIMDDEMFEKLLFTTKVNDIMLEQQAGLVVYQAFEDFDKNGSKEGFIVTAYDAADKEDLSYAGPISAKIRLFYTDAENITPTEVENGGIMSDEGYTFNISPSAFYDSDITLLDSDEGVIFHYAYDSSWETYSKYYGVKDGAPYEILENEVPASAKAAEEVSEDADWKKAYIKYIDEYHPEYEDLSYMSCQLFHLDDDGIPELMIGGGSHVTCDVFLSYKNGELQVYEYGFGDSQYYCPYRNRLSTEWPVMGETSVEFLELTDEGWNKLAESLVMYGPGYDDGNEYPQYTFDGTDCTGDDYRQKYAEYVDFRFATRINMSEAYAFGDVYNSIINAINTY